MSLSLAQAADVAVRSAPAVAEAAKRQKVDVLVLLLVGVGLVGLLLLAIVLVMGSRTRRITRDEGPQPTAADPYEVLRDQRRRTGQSVDDDEVEGLSGDRG